jgi:hypothetical protein
MYSSFIYFVANDRISFLFKDEQYFTVYIYHIFFVHSSVDEHLSWIHTLPVVNSATINTGIQVFLCYGDFISFGYIPRSGILELYIRFVFSFMKNFHSLPLVKQKPKSGISRSYGKCILAWWETDKLFFQSSCTTYISTSSVWKFQLL